MSQAGCRLVGTGNAQAKDLRDVEVGERGYHHRDHKSDDQHDDGFSSQHEGKREVARATQREEVLSARNFLLARDRFCAGATVLLQFVMERFQADAEDLRGPRLVVAGRLQGLQDQHFLCFFHSGAHTQANRIGIIGRGAQRGLSKSWRQMFGFNHAGIAHDDGPLDSVA